MCLRKECVMYKNVLIYRQWTEQDKIADVFSGFNTVIFKYEADKIGPLISTTHNIIEYDGHKLLDFEVIIPINKEIPSCGNYWFVKKWELHNVMTNSYKGDPARAEDSVKKLVNYLADKQITAKSSVYSALFNEQINMVDLELMIECEGGEVNGHI